MVFNYLNAVRVGTADGGYSPKMSRKLMWSWLVKVVGWQDIEKSGTRWDDALLTGTDGATDVSDSSKFTSATGGFTSDMVGCQLLICPSNPPAPTGGFIDQTRNGFYYIRSVEDTNTLYVDKDKGVSIIGLPSGETGLNFEIINYKTDSSYCPQNGDYYVIRGTGTNSNEFDLKNTESSDNYNLQLSPFADWVSGSPGSFNPSNRLTNETNIDGGSSSDIAIILGIADVSHAILWIRHYNYAFGVNYAHTIYIGEIDSFNPSFDSNPYVLLTINTGTYNDTFANNLYTLGADDLTPLSSHIGYMSVHDYSSTNALSGERKSRSDFSGRFVQLPFVIYENGTGFSEVRGIMKNLYLGHDNASGLVVPFGDNLDKLRISNMVIDWNGSRVLENIY